MVNQRPRNPKPLPLLRWDIYRAAAKAKWFGEVEATDVHAAIEAAAKEFRPEPAKLIAVRRSPRSFLHRTRTARRRSGPPGHRRQLCSRTDQPADVARIKRVLITPASDLSN